MPTPEGHQALAVIVKGVEPPCSVAPVSEVLEWVVGLFGDQPGTASLELRLACDDAPADVLEALAAAATRRSGLRRVTPGRHGRTVRLDLTDADDRAVFCALAPWCVDARIRRDRRHLLGLADGTRSFWVELPDEAAEDLRKWFRRRALGRLIDIDTWVPPNNR